MAAFFVLGDLVIYGIITVNRSYTQRWRQKAVGIP